MNPRRLIALQALLAWLAAPTRADDPFRRGFDADPSRPALTLDAGLAVETAAPARAGDWQLGVRLERAAGLLALDEGSRRDDLLSRRTSLHLLAGRAFERLELAIHLPVILAQRSDLSPLTRQGVTGPLVAPIATSGLGDLRGLLKVPLLDEGRAPVALAALLDLRLPTGDRAAFAGDGLSAVPSLVATRRLGPLRLDGQAGWSLRRPGQFAQLVVHDGLAWGLGAALDLPRAGPLARWRAHLELGGAVPRGFDPGSARQRAPLGARAGLRAWLSDRLAVEAGGGAGLGESGYGHERWRVFAGLRWTGAAPPAPRPGDRDGDGVPDAQDRCPDEPGSPALDGCPDADGDGIPDVEDRCPREPGPAERAGCPLPPDEPVVALEATRLSLHDAITFDTDRDTIRPESLPLLDQVARLLAAHPELGRLRVEGHTDDVGSAAYNKDLSARRAAAVVRYLVQRGVAGGRLQAAGFGLERPIASNATALGRARNRRVEFTVIEGPGVQGPGVEGHGAR